MNIARVIFKIFILCAFTLTNANQSFSQDDLTAVMKDADFEEEIQWLQAETFVITASRIPEDIKKSAASITVITDKQIRQMGARHIMDVLRTVPGMSYYYSSFGMFSIDSRGIRKGSSEHILIMVNSHPLNENFTGGATYVYDTMAVDNIKRIEFIRGPGSAVYGANAFSGVINIITKEAEDVDGLEIRANGGSFDTQQYNFLYGKTFNDIGIAFNFNYLNKDGFEGDIEQDYQTILDRFFGTNASLAPGETRGDEEKYDISLTLQYKGIKFDGRYIDHARETGFGYCGALDNISTESIKDYYLNLSYERNIWEGLDLLGKVYRNHYHFDNYYQCFPEGAAVITPRGVKIVPEGTIIAPSAKNNRTGFEIHTTCKMNDSNTVLAGVTYEKMKQYDVRFKANNLYTPIPFVFIPFPSVWDITRIQNFNKSVSRTFKAIFIEDLWDITDDIRFTTGARYDRYSDFGGSLNPRAGLTWEFKKGYDLKMIYGHAFRAPSFHQLYNANSPTMAGNPDLDPEEVDTYEVSLGAEFNPYLSGRITFFQNTIKDNIGLSFDKTNWRFVFENRDKIRSKGFEAEMKYDFGRGSYLAVNYTYQDAENLDTDQRLWDVPRQKGNIMANIRLSRYLNFYTDCHIQDGFKREKGDYREDNSGFGVVNATLIMKKFLERYEEFEIRASVYNLFDKKYTFPTSKDSMPSDHPMPGRNFIIELQYEF
ncbi:MAG: TonB-dependent receptor [Thermodesulfobacteriota bacterium]|nr:TonB-dependent receptor [Thermodesulfobacteriota bacterium]